MAHARFVQPLCQQVQHGGELAEQQDAVAALHGGGDQLHAGVQLGAAAGPVVSHKAGVAADLPQPHEHRKHRHFVLGLGGAQLLAGVHHGGKVQLALFGVQLDAVDIFGLGRQLPQHIRLHAAQDERPGELIQPPHGVGIFLLHDGLFKPGTEVLVRRQIARHEEGEDAPQLAQPVLHRGAGQGKAYLTADLAHGLVFLGGMVLDGLCFVQDAGIEGLFGVAVLIAAQQVVAGHHKIGLCPPAGQHSTVGGVAVHCHTGELWGELFALFLPVQHQ